MRKWKLSVVLAALMLGLQLVPAQAEEPNNDPAEDTAQESAGDPSKQKCEIAEVNPVTGHAICIKPIGAPVEMPPPEENVSEDCLPGNESTEDWSWSSKCRPESPGQ